MAATATATIDLSGERLHMRDLANRTATRARVIGGVALGAALLLGALWGGASFVRGYVINFMFFLSLGLGGLLFVLIQHVTRAGWSVAIRRFAEHAAMTLQTMGLLAIPLVLVMLGWDVPLLAAFEAQAVYSWIDPQVVLADEVLDGKYGYLNVPFFLMRMVIYFTVWIAMARFFYGSSVRQDETGDAGLTASMQAWSAPCILAAAVTLTFCAIDLLMTLDPHWFSTIYGVYYFAGAFLGFMCLSAVAFLLLQQHGRVENVVTMEHYHDIGKLMFAFVVFWAYIGFSQYMLIWYANIPEETVFIVARHHGVWGGLSLIMLFGHFVLPFLYLITRWTKRNRGQLMFAALWLLFMHWLDIIWLVLPQAHIPHGATSVEQVEISELLLSDVCFIVLLAVGIGGIWLASLLDSMGRSALIPTRDPRLATSLAFENY